MRHFHHAEPIIGHDLLGGHALANFIVQNFDGYVVIPMVARRTVDLPPALTLASQILASSLFGVMGLALADPMVAMIKVAIQRESELAAKAETAARHKRAKAAPPPA